jgi:5-methylcytosine-specific restriction protein A
MNYKTREERQNFYSSPEWKILRKYMLQLQPLCEMCLRKDRITVATELHHIRDIADAPHLRLDTSNLMPICKSCHSTITVVNSSGTMKYSEPVNKIHNVKAKELKKPKL